MAVTLCLMLVHFLQKKFFVSWAGCYQGKLEWNPLWSGRVWSCDTQKHFIQYKQSNLSLDLKKAWTSQNEWLNLKPTILEVLVWSLSFRNHYNIYYIIYYSLVLSCAVLWPITKNYHMCKWMLKTKKRDNHETV